MPGPSALVFPGQGSQRVGMIGAVPAAASCTPNPDELLALAEERTGLPLASIAADGPDHTLADTRAAQPLLYITDWLWGSALLAAGVAPTIVAGHSLGELAALAIAGVYSVETGLELVCRRALLMAEAAAATPGGMAAVIGLDSDTVVEAIDALPGVWTANDNAPGQIVISGTHDGIERATAALSAAGARRIVPLAVAGPFHSPLMADAAQRFASEVASVALSDARIPVIQNADPAPATSATLIGERLQAQIVSPVRWTETMIVMRDNGIVTVVEAGPGAVLTGLARRIDGLNALAAEGVGVHGIVEVCS